ncbi:MAG: DNA cytosine methyltransferase [Aridibacter sp.]
MTLDKSENKKPDSYFEKYTEISFEEEACRRLKERENNLNSEIDKKPIAVSLFSGCGGIDLGLIKAGYEVVWANDIDEDCCETYKENIGNHINCGDIRELPVPNYENIDLMTAGFPCQPFSNAGNRLGTKDDRGNLFEETFRFIEKLNPKALIYENVRGLLSFKNKEKDGKLIDEILESLRDLGYEVEYRLVNFSHFGVPQNRIRVIIVGVKNDKYLPYVFPEVEREKDLSIQTTLKGITKKMPNHNELMRLNPQALHYGSMIPEGGSWKSLSYEVLPERWKKIHDNMARYHYPNFFRRYSRKDVQGTITASFKPENAAVWHPTKDRIYSVREIARFQTFPDDFVFFGSSVKSKYKQIGNAVPPLFAELMGKQLLPYINNKKPSSLKRLKPESTEFNVNRPINYKK